MANILHRGVSVIIPAYNEQKGITETLSALKTVLQEQPFDIEIIVVNDGSTDHTKTLAQQHAITVISHPTNRGYGAAIKTGVQQSKYDAILITDADGTYPAQEIPALLKQIGESDMVVGARTGASVAIPWIRKPAKWVLSKLANYLSNASIADLNSGLRLFRKNIFNKYLRLFPDGFSLTTTLTLAMHTNNHRVVYLPINYRKREGKSKIRPIWDTANFFLLILRTSLLFNPLKIFLTISLMLFLAAIFVFFFSLFFLPYTLDITAVVLFVGGMQILATGMIADLINRKMNSS